MAIFPGELGFVGFLESSSSNFSRL